MTIAVMKVDFGIAQMGISAVGKTVLIKQNYRICAENVTEQYRIRRDLLRKIRKRKKRLRV